MMKRNALFTRLIMVVWLTSLLACSDHKISQTESQTTLYIQYISAYTSGVIKRNNAIKVRLAKDAEDVKPGQRIDERLFDFLPAIQGTTTWEDRRTIVFKPKDRLPSNTKYDVRFALHKVTEVADELKTFSFNFQTIQQAYEVKLLGLETESLEDLKKYKLLGILQTADFSDHPAIEKMLSASQNGTTLTVRWTHEDDTQHTFEINNIIRHEKEGQMEVRWSGKPNCFSGISPAPTAFQGQLLHRTGSP